MVHTSSRLRPEKLRHGKLRCASLSHCRPIASQWLCLISPKTTQTTDAQALWSGRLESVRKDVKCFFGYLKGRFRIFKMGILYRDEEDIHNVFSRVASYTTHCTHTTGWMNMNRKPTGLGRMGSTRFWIATHRRIAARWAYGHPMSAATPRSRGSLSTQHGKPDLLSTWHGRKRKGYWVCSGAPVVGHPRTTDVFLFFWLTA